MNIIAELEAAEVERIIEKYKEPPPKDEDFDEDDEETRLCQDLQAVDHTNSVEFRVAHDKASEKKTAYVESPFQAT